MAAGAGDGSAKSVVYLFKNIYSPDRMSVAGRKRTCLTFEFEISRRIEDEDLLQLGHVCWGDLQRRTTVSREPPSASKRGEIQAFTTDTHTGARTQIPHARTRVHQHCCQLSASVVKQTQFIRFIYFKFNIVFPYFPNCVQSEVNT